MWTDSASLATAGESAERVTHHEINAAADHSGKPRQ
jgi:hypothetical protein